MLQKLVLTMVLASISVASAKQLSAQDIKERLQLNADIYMVDASGKKVLSGPSSVNYWRANAEKGAVSGDWSTQNEDGLIAFRYHWHVEDDSSIKVLLEEYAITSEHRENPEYKNLLEKKEFILENFEPVVWKVKNIKDKNYIVRFIPSLREVSTPISVESLPIAATGVSISDNQGYLWAEDLEFSGKYTGVKSHRGTLGMSYVPFEGAKEMGFAEGNKIILNVDKKFQVTLKAATSFLPAGVTAKVYAIYLPEKKSKGFNSLHSFDSNKEDRFLTSLKK
jgi:hypothetical protein